MLTKERRLADLPNQAGFRFVGTGKNGEEWTCVIRKDSSGRHWVCREDDDSHCWFALSSWRTSNTSGE